MKVIVASLISLMIITSTANAESNTFKNTSDYITLVNENMAQLDINTSNEEKATIGTLLKNGVRLGYLNPSMNNEIKLRDALIGLVDNIESYNIENSMLENIHDDLLNNSKDLIGLLNERIECKEKVLNSNNKLMEYKYILIDDGENVNLINDKIDLINESYKDIRNFNKKFCSNKYS